MMLSNKAKQQGARAQVAPAKKAPETPKLEALIAKRDYVGAITLLEFELQTQRELASASGWQLNGRTGEYEWVAAGQASSQKPEAAGEAVRRLLWLGYAAFHAGDFKKALDTYTALQEEHGLDEPELHTYAACCLLALGWYKEADERASRAPPSALQNRLVFHISHRLNDEAKLMAHHQKLHDTTEDQLSLASIHFLRNHFQEATDIYKRLLLENRDFAALNVYVALCYYKLDYYDVSLEILNAYLAQQPDSAVALNLKACNQFKLYDGKAAEAELAPLVGSAASFEKIEADLVRHNLVVFRKGERALQVLPPLIDSVSEARLNLVIYHMHQGETEEAYNLLKELEPASPQEYILKGVVNLAMGQALDSREHLKVAQQYFQLVGASASECDTIPGRQCMASCFFILRQFDDVLIYLKSIESYFPNDEAFIFNYGVARAAAGQTREAEAGLLSLQAGAHGERYRADYVYNMWLARCYIRNGKSRAAWELYLKLESSQESFAMLQLLANDCYRVGAFLYAAKAFDTLERLDPNPEYWDGKRGACVGVFQMIIAGKERKETLREVLAILKNTRNPQVEYFTQVMKKWGRENGVTVG